MAHLQPPGSFNFHKPEEWSKWSKRYDHYRLASGLSTATAAKQVSTFLYCLGEDAEDFLVSMGVTEDDRATYNAIKARFDAFFEVRHNVIYEHAQFNGRVQLPGEMVKDYIVALHSLADRCRYQDMKDDLIWNRLVVGIRDRKLSEEL